MKRFSFFKLDRCAGCAIRADQVSEYLDSARVNPTEGYENDVCIYSVIKPPEDHPENCYWDMYDIFPFADWAMENPEVKIITLSNSGRDYVSSVLDRDDIICIPQHHCNFDREVRERDEVRTAGIVGGLRSYEWDRIFLRHYLEDMGIEYIETLHPRNRKSVVDFFKRVDIQIVFRPRRSRSKSAGMLSSSLKLANACSFGVPTVSLPERAFVDEFDGCFLSVNSHDELLKGIKKLKDDPIFYKELSEKARERAEKYHIENIVKLYQQL
jgi:hypothetical protein